MGKETPKKLIRKQLFFDDDKALFNIRKREKGEPDRIVVSVNHERFRYMDRNDLIFIKYILEQNAIAIDKQLNPSNYCQCKTGTSPLMAF